MIRELSLIRADISAIDKQMIALLKERIGLSVEVAMYKSEHGIPVFDPAREAEILAQIDDPHIRAIYQAIMGESKKVQEQAIINDFKKSS